MPKKVVVVWGGNNCGKTSTLNLLIEHLLGIKGSNVLTKEHCLIIKTKGKCKHDRVGIATRGDTEGNVRENCKFFDKCNLLSGDKDIVFLAVRSSKDPTTTPPCNKVATVIQKYADSHGATIVPQQKTKAIPPVSFIMSNQKMEKLLYKLI